ncbi:BET1-like protein [Patella vulgata]|uniref:BET1-like protein n=1 Tax=Patella vulgata TaxID=6465 RepID=UPI00217FD2F0|nr:BET1-like protein [Patella vulgata]
MADYRTRNGKTEEMLDYENQQKVEGLSSKISRLKEIAVDLDHESRDSNSFLDSMTDNFGSATGLLSGSMSRMSHMVNSGKGNRKLMCYIILGLVVMFFLTYYLVTRVTSG